jgi:O-methyltransferase involved in polyketide biosynthesis
LLHDGDAGVGPAGRAAEGVVVKLSLQIADPVSKTLLIPLLARALEQREPEPLVRDPLAAEMVEQLDVSSAGPVLLVSEAVLVYFEEGRVRDLVVEITRRCPGAELVTDVCTPLAVRLDNLQLMVTRSSARLHWAVRDPRELEAWAQGIELVESFCYFDHLEPRRACLPGWLGSPACVVPAASSGTGWVRLPRPG